MVHSALFLLAGLRQKKNIEAVIALAAEIPDVEVNVIGDGPLQSTVAHAAATYSNLHYLGWLDRDALRDEIDRNDCLVLALAF